MIPQVSLITIEPRPLNARLWELEAKRLDGSISLEEEVELERVCREIEGDASSSGGRSGLLRTEPLCGVSAVPGPVAIADDNGGGR